MFQCERVDLGFIDTAPFRFRNSIELNITPEQLFEVFADTESWPKFVSLISKVVWTSPEPIGVGATRCATLRGGIVCNEEFIAWEPFKRIAFRFNDSSSRIFAALAEDYQVEPIPAGCRLTWTMAQKPAGAARLPMSAVSPLLNVILRRFLRNLRGYTDTRFAATQQR